MTTDVVTIVTTCFAAFIQSASGFGFALFDIVYILV